MQRVMARATTRKAQWHTPQQQVAEECYLLAEISVMLNIHLRMKRGRYRELQKELIPGPLQDFFKESSIYRRYSSIYSSSSSSSSRIVAVTHLDVDNKYAVARKVCALN
jgi:hypothetical protein